MNIGIDFHDTLTYNPEFFIELMSAWDEDNIYIISGTALRDKYKIDDWLEENSIANFKEVLVGFDYDGKTLDKDHFNKMAEHKYLLLKAYNIGVYFDDNPFYASYLRNKGILVFQTILSDEYIDSYKKDTKFHSGHFQKGQWDFLKTIK